MNEISDTESTAPNVRISEREIHPVEILEPTTKVQVYMQAYKVKKIYKQTKKEAIIRSWYEKTIAVHKNSTSTICSHIHLRR